MKCILTVVFMRTTNISYPVAIFHDSEHYQEHQIVLREAGATRAYNGPLRHNEGRIGRNFELLIATR